MQIARPSRTFGGRFAETWADNAEKSVLISDEINQKNFYHTGID
jgi:hypothetical protein